MHELPITPLLLLSQVRANQEFENLKSLLMHILERLCYHQSPKREIKSIYAPNLVSVINDDTIIVANMCFVEAV